jgi:hypothetical protein
VGAIIFWKRRIPLPTEKKQPAVDEAGYPTEPIPVLTEDELKPINFNLTPWTHNVLFHNCFRDDRINSDEQYLEYRVSGWNVHPRNNKYYYKVVFPQVGKEMKLYHNNYHRHFSTIAIEAMMRDLGKIPDDCQYLFPKPYPNFVADVDEERFHQYEIAYRILREHNGKLFVTSLGVNDIWKFVPSSWDICITPPPIDTFDDKEIADYVHQVLPKKEFIRSVNILVRDAIVHLEQDVLIKKLKDEDRMNHPEFYENDDEDHDHNGDHQKKKKNPIDDEEDNNSVESNTSTITIKSSNRKQSVTRKIAKTSALSTPNTSSSKQLAVVLSGERDCSKRQIKPNALLDTPPEAFIRLQVIQENDEEDNQKTDGKVIYV